MTTLALCLLSSGCLGRGIEAFDPVRDAEKVATCYAAYKNIVIFVVRPVTDEDLERRLEKTEGGEDRLSPYFEASAQASREFAVFDLAARKGIELGGLALGDPTTPDRQKRSIIDSNLRKIAHCERLISQWSMRAPNKP